MSNTKMICIRFNLDKPQEREAFEFLKNADKASFKSYSKAVTAAVADYFKRYYISLDDPYFETREREERFVSQIVEAVEKAIEKALPSFLTACLTGIVKPYAVTAMPEQQKNEPQAEEVDWDFLNG